MRFALQTYPERRRQPVASVNYPTSEDFTRITEMGHLTGEWGEATMLSTEYPGAHRPGENEPHYPVPREENRELHKRYAALAKKEAPHVVFAGRLGDYSYYNMDQAVARALSLFDKVAAKQRL
jgi:UDP-galactopyranose mutase